MLPLLLQAEIDECINENLMSALTHNKPAFVELYLSYDAKIYKVWAELQLLLRCGVVQEAHWVMNDGLLTACWQVLPGCWRLGVVCLCAPLLFFNCSPWLLVSCVVSGAVQLKPLKKRALPGVPLFYTAIEELYEVRPHSYPPIRRWCSVAASCSATYRRSSSNIHCFFSFFLLFLCIRVRFCRFPFFFSFFFFLVHVLLGVPWRCFVTVVTERSEPPAQPRQAAVKEQQAH